MATCLSCQADLMPGSRWCAICHASTHGAASGILASPGKRLGAYFLDVFIPLMAALAMAGTAAAVQSGGVFILLLIAYAVWALVLFTRGTTPGKNLLGMHVITERGQPATFLTMLIREWIGKWISGLVFGLGYIWILIDRDRQGWHDKLVSTYVVDRPA